jgi:hypothetical protein
MVRSGQWTLELNPETPAMSEVKLSRWKLRMKIVAAYMGSGESMEFLASKGRARHYSTRPITRQAIYFQIREGLKWMLNHGCFKKVALPGGSLGAGSHDLGDQGVDSPAESGLSESP